MLNDNHNSSLWACLPFTISGLLIWLLCCGGLNQTILLFTNQNQFIVAEAQKPEFIMSTLGEAPDTDYVIPNEATERRLNYVPDVICLSAKDINETHNNQE